VVRPARSAELPHGEEPAAPHARRSAQAKAAEVAAAHPGRLVLGADTVVSLGEGAEHVLGKPADPAEAAAMLRLLSGRTHEVVTGLALMIAGPMPREIIRSVRSVVCFRELRDDLIARYVATGEPLDKAGAYGIQGRLASQVVSIEGSWSNVVGLPQGVLPDLFAGIGLDLSDWQDW
jgi:septum formation protein